MSTVIDFLLPDYTFELFIIAFLLCSFLGFFSYAKRVLDLKGSIMAVIVGLLIIGYSDFFWFLLMLLFFTLSYMVTRWRYQEKRERGLIEGTNGERGIRNVFANGIIPVVIALFSGPLNEISEGLAPLLFVVAIAIAASDTFASEIGVIARNPRLITNPSEIVRPGVDGGVSFLGNTAALLGGILISFAGFFLITDYLISAPPHFLEDNPLWMLIPVILGWFGCQFDSFLGATLQRRGMISNNMVNFITVVLGTILAIPIYLLIV
jgi:uncharacterized protein (TIGR00297 family)